MNYDSVALPDNFCIIESREEVKASNPLSSSCYEQACIPYKHQSAHWASAYHVTALPITTSCTCRSCRCILPSWDTAGLAMARVQDFADMDLRDIRDNITARRNKIFLLMEEVRCAALHHVTAANTPSPVAMQQIRCYT
jgi:hypothetical protein